VVCHGRQVGYWREQLGVTSASHQVLCSLWRVLRFVNVDALASVHPLPPPSALLCLVRPDLTTSACMLQLLRISGIPMAPPSSDYSSASRAYSISPVGPSAELAD